MNSNNAIRNMVARVTNVRKCDAICGRRGFSMAVSAMIGSERTATIARFAIQVLYDSSAAVSGAGDNPRPCIATAVNRTKEPE